MTNFFLKQLRRLSLGFLLITFLFSYVQLPDSVAFEYDGRGLPIGFVDKQYFFYGSVMIFLLLILLFGLLRNQLSKFHFGTLFPSSQWAANAERLNALLLGWADAFFAFINFFLGFTFLSINSVNNSVDRHLDRNYDWFLLIGASLLIFFVFFLPIRLLFTKPVLDQ